MAKKRSSPTQMTWGDAAVIEEHRRRIEQCVDAIEALTALVAAERTRRQELDDLVHKLAGELLAMQEKGAAHA